MIAEFLDHAARALMEPRFLFWGVIVPLVAGVALSYYLSYKNNTLDRLYLSDRISFIFAWYDMWIGAYYDRKEKVLYICPIPMCVIRIHLGPREAWLPDRLNPSGLTEREERLLRANRPEPDPLHNSGDDIWPMVIEEAKSLRLDSQSGGVWDTIIQDMEERNAIGTAKYGTPLQAFNGRDPLVDAYQEELDSIVYLRQYFHERPNHWVARLYQGKMRNLYHMKRTMLLDNATAQEGVQNLRE